MVKKGLGALLIVVAALILIGSIANGSLIGTVIPIGVYIFAGIFLITFDGIYKKAFVEGFKARKKQCAMIVLFLVIYLVFMFLAGLGAGYSGSDNFVLTFVVAALPYFIPMMIFVIMLAYYAIPYWNCNKNFKFDESILNEYLSNVDSFKSYAEDNSVLANSKVLFLTKTFCAFPLEQIESTKFTNIVVEQDIFINLTNGKKIELVGGKKMYDSIVAAIEANKQ